jgi:magnesium transporter
MIEIYQRNAQGVVSRAADCDIALTQTGLVWIDLDRPTPAEEEQVEQALGIDVLTATERNAVEESARFYEEDGALYLTPTLLGRREDGPFLSDSVTFILTGAGTLVTVRQIHPRAFAMGAGRASARIEHAADGGAVLMALLDACLERIADLLQQNTTAARQISAEIFAEDARPIADARDRLRHLGRLGAMAALMHESLSTILRAAAFAAQHAGGYGLDAARLTAVRRDSEQLERAVEGFQGHLAHLQDAILGLVGAAQNNTIRALSMATMAFAPPTLIASIFGMNFKAMTWFDADWGPRVAILLMLLGPALLFALARWRKWF